MRNNQRFFIITTVMFFWTINLSAQGLDTLWTKTYGGADDEFGRAVRETSDGGYVIVGEKLGSVFLIKTDVNGNGIWSRLYGGSQPDAGYSVQQTSDSGYIITGYTYNFGVLGSDIWLLKTDMNGDTLWTKTYGGTGEDVGRSVHQTLDKGFIIAGCTSSFGAGSYDVYLVRTDSIGDTMWTRTYGGTSDDRGRDVQITYDGGYIVSGYTRSFGHGYRDFYLIRTNKNGESLWQKTYGGTKNEECYSVYQTSDDGYIASGYTRSFGQGFNDVYLIKTDADGYVIFEKTYGGTEWDNGLLVQQSSDGGYIIAGVTNSFGQGNNDVYLIKTDADGDTLWRSTFGGTDSDNGNSVQCTSDGGYIVAGATRSFGNGNYDVYLIKTQSEDTLPPLIDSTTIWQDTSYVGPFFIKTKVTDRIGVDTVLLYFKRREDISWFSKGMILYQNAWFYEQIPPVSLPNDTVKYYIYARDKLMYESTDPPGVPEEYFCFVANTADVKENPQKPDGFFFRVNDFVKAQAIFRFSLAERSNISVKIYDVVGRVISSPISGEYSRGDYEVSFRPERKGIYFYRLESTYKTLPGKFVVF